MKRLTSIVAMSHEGAIGAHNRLPWRLKSDLKFFREQTSGQVVIMGRHTYDSLGKKCLPNRQNIILSHSLGLIRQESGCRGACGIDEGLYIADKLADHTRECFVIGGASMYEQFSSLVDRYLVTLVNKFIPEADTFVDEHLFGIADDWIIREIHREGGDGVDNEVGFCILELTSKKADIIAARRLKKIETYENALRKGPASRRAEIRKPYRQTLGSLLSA